MNINNFKIFVSGEFFLIRNLEKKHIKDLYNFYNKFDKNEKEYFGYPLFQPIDLNLKQLKFKYNQYLDEKNSWYYFLLYKNNNLVGLSYVKKIGFKNKKREKNKSPTLGGPFVLKEFRRKKLGFVLLNTIIYQLRLLKVKHLYSRHDTKNVSAISNSIKCGFKFTGKKYLNKNKRYDKEYVIRIK